MATVMRILYWAVMPRAISCGGGRILIRILTPARYGQGGRSKIQVQKSTTIKCSEILMVMERTSWCSGIRWEVLYSSPKFPPTQSRLNRGNTTQYIHGALTAK